MFEIIYYFVGIVVTSIVLFIAAMYLIYYLWSYLSISLSWWWLNVKMHNKYKKFFDAPLRNKKFIRLRFLLISLNPIYVFKELKGCEYGLSSSNENPYGAYADFTRLIPSIEMRLEKNK